MNLDLKEKYKKLLAYIEVPGEALGANVFDKNYKFGWKSIRTICFGILFQLSCFWTMYDFYPDYNRIFKVLQVYFAGIQVKYTV